MKKILLMGICIMMVLTTMSCSNKEKEEKKEESPFIWGTDYVKCDTKLPDETEQIGFDIPFAYSCNREDFNVELITYEGKGLEQCSINVSDDSVDEWNAITNGSYRLGLLGVVIDVKMIDAIEVDSITIKIKGKEQKLIFNEPLRFKKVKNEDDFQELLTADIIGSDSKVVLSYKVSANDKLKIIDWYMSDPYTIQDEWIEVNDEKNSQNKKEISLKKSDEVRFHLSIVAEEKNQYNFTIFDYTIKYINKKQVEKEYIIPIVKQGVDNEESCKNVLKQLVETNGR